MAKNYYSLIKKCLDCNILITNYSIRCKKCSNKFSTNTLKNISIKKQIIKYKSLLLSKDAEQVLLGSLLGDGSLRKPKYSSSYSEAHSLKQKDYLLWKRDILNLPHRLSLVCFNQLKEYFEIVYQTNALPQLIPYYNLFYPNGKKIVTQEILDKLEPLAIATWYMDDGSYDLEVHLATNCFSYESHLLIQNWFKFKWGINTVIRQNKKKQYNIAIKRRDSPLFINLVKDYIPPSMQYKINYDIKKFRIRDRARQGTKERKMSDIKKYNKKRLKIFLSTFCQLCNQNCYGKYCKECRHKNTKKIKGNVCVDCNSRCTYISMRCRSCSNHIRIRDERGRFYAEAI